MTIKTVFENEKIRNNQEMIDIETLSKSAKEVYKKYGPEYYKHWNQIKNEDMNSKVEEEEEVKESNQIQDLSESEIEASKEVFGSMASRFGKKLSKTKWGAVPYMLYKYQNSLGLKINEVWFLVWIFMHKWDHKHPYPSLRAMKRYTGKSRQHISNIANGLEKKGMIKIIRRKRKSGATDTNQYNIYPLIELLEKEIEIVPNIKQKRRAEI